MYSFPDLEPVCCSMSSSNCCFLTGIQISQEAGKVVWYSHLFKNFPQCAVIHTVKDFVIVNKAEVEVLLELSCFFDDPVDVGNLISGSSAFSKASHISLKGNCLLACLTTHPPGPPSHQSPTEIILVEFCPKVTGVRPPQKWSPEPRSPLKLTEPLWLCQKPPDHY